MVLDMKENCLERMKRIKGDEKIASFIVKQKESYDFKIKYAEIRAKEFVRECENRELNYHVSVGGLDSITLYLFLKHIGIDAHGISVSYLEDTSIQKIHKQLGIESLLSATRADGTHWNKGQIIQEFGFPVISKETASKIETLANPTEKNITVRNAIVTGETGEYGGYQKNSRMKMSQKWLEKFGGYANDDHETNYQIPDFKVSSKCCFYLKEKPCDDWAKEHNSVPFLGLMASEGGRRAKSLMINGCNYFGKSTIRSAPFAIFTRQDLLQLVLELNVPIPEIYGSIEKKEDGTLYTTKAQRTGCSMCGFGIHLEKRPHRFDQLRERNPKEWHYWMYECYRNDETGQVFGWGHVLDYIGVPWKDEFHEKKECDYDMGKITSKKATADMFSQTENTENAEVTTTAAEVIAENDTTVITTLLMDAKSYNSCIKKINDALTAVRKSFFKIAFALEWIDNTNAFVLDECDSIESFAKNKFGIGKTSTYNYIHVARRFGADRDEKTGEIKELKAAFKSYSPTQLIILYDSKVTDKQIEDLGINSALTCAEIKNRLKGLNSIEDKPKSNDTGDSDTGDNDTNDSGTTVSSSNESTDDTTILEESGIMTDGRQVSQQYTKTNNLLTIASLEDFDKQKDSILELIRKTLSQDGLQCSVTINMAWN